MGENKHIENLKPKKWFFPKLQIFAVISLLNNVTERLVEES